MGTPVVTLRRPGAPWDTVWKPFEHDKIVLYWNLSFFSAEVEIVFIMYFLIYFSVIGTMQ